MGNNDTSWLSMKKFIGEASVQAQIISFDARNINPSSRDAVEALLKEKAKSFDPENARRARYVFFF